MLNSKQRFHRRKHVARVYNKGRSVRGVDVSLKYLINRQATNIKIGVVVSKKVSKSAVVRNRIRRRVFEAVRLRVDDLDPGFEGVFTIFNISVADCDFEYLQAQVDKLINKSKQTE